MADKAIFLRDLTVKVMKTVKARITTTSTLCLKWKTKERLSRISTERLWKKSEESNSWHKKRLKRRKLANDDKSSPRLND
jgi:hypothetical protein